MIHPKISNYRDLFAPFFLVMIFIFIGSNFVNASPLRNPLTSNTTEEKTIDKAELAKSINTLITTLENTKQRQQLIQDLKKVRDGLKANPTESTLQDTKIIGGLTSLYRGLSNNEDPVTFWQNRLEKAKVEVDTLLPPLKDLPSFILNFMLVILLWILVAKFTLWLIKQLQDHYHLSNKLGKNPNTLTLLIYAVRKLLPWAIAFVITYYGSRFVLPNSASPLGKSAAILFSYSLLGGVFSAICFLLLSLLSGEHRWGALRILRTRAFKLIFSIGVFASMGDALTSRQLIELLNENLSAVLSTINNIIAATLTGWFVISYHRPITHLIRNRSLKYRTSKKNAYELLRFLSYVWNVPVLMLVIASLVATAFSGDTTTTLRKALLTAMLAIVALVFTGIVKRYSTNLLNKAKRHQNFLYTMKLMRFGYSVLTCFIWVVFADLALRVWGSSLTQFSQGAGHDIIIIATIMLTIFGTRLLWILIDTAIYRALTGIGKSGPSTRA